MTPISSGFGISTQCNNNSLSDKSGNEFYQNIVMNCPVGFRFQFEHEQKVFNNIALNCNIGLASSRNYKGVGANANFKNNIFVNSKKYHINWHTGAKNFVINSDHNLYYPVTGHKFRLREKDLTFAQWKSRWITGLTLDANSLADDPLFKNASGNYSETSDFHLRPNSPAVDAGIPVGLIEDFLGNGIVKLPDAGAFEFKP